MTTPATIEAFGREWRARRITAAGAVDACLSAIEAGNPKLNAFILVMADEARRQARVADGELAAGRDRGPLHGVPISVKDIIDIRGTATTAASRVRDGHLAGRDAPAIARLRQAGAVLVGKVNLHEFALGTTSEDSAYGPVRNPHDPARSAGGSSGGSAASIAAGMALASIGTDTGGSIRIPAAACGVVGLKPAFGEVPTEGVVPLSRTLDHVGPLAASVADAALVYRVLAGADPASPLVPTPVRGVRLALLRTYFCDMLDDEVRARFQDALGILRAGGAHISEAEVPHAEQIGPAYLHIGLAEAAAVHAKTLDRCPNLYTAPVRARLEMGRRLMAEDYVRALRGREQLRLEVDAALADCDGLVLPTLPIPAPPIGADLVPVGSTSQPVRSAMLKMTQLFNLTGHPAVSLPCGRTASGLPCGLQLVGAREHTGNLLRVALGCEAALAGGGSLRSGAFSR